MQERFSPAKARAMQKGMQVSLSMEIVNNHRIICHELKLRSKSRKKVCNVTLSFQRLAESRARNN